MTNTTDKQHLHSTKVLKHVCKLESYGWNRNGKGASQTCSIKTWLKDKKAL